MASQTVRSCPICGKDYHGVVALCVTFRTLSVGEKKAGLNVIGSDSIFYHLCINLMLVLANIPAGSAKRGIVPCCTLRLQLLLHHLLLRFQRKFPQWILSKVAAHPLGRGPPSLPSGYWCKDLMGVKACGFINTGAAMSCGSSHLAKAKRKRQTTMTND